MIYFNPQRRQVPPHLQLLRGIKLGLASSEVGPSLGYCALSVQGQCPEPDALGRSRVLGFEGTVSFVREESSEPAALEGQAGPNLSPYVRRHRPVEGSGEPKCGLPIAFLAGESLAEE